MPYEAKKDGEDYIVVNTDTGAEKARHTPPDAQGKAERQIRLLNEIEKNPAWDGNDG
jgi:hypothetical protein